jgi:transcriptional regulator with XRE-family HTH domain
MVLSTGIFVFLSTDEQWCAFDLHVASVGSIPSSKLTGTDNMEQVSAYHRSDATKMIKLQSRGVEGSLRRTELAGFLRTRRESLSPSEAGILGTSRRRVKGLRREEVAEAAGISVAWYAWIEQARDLRISENTLDRLCRALHLNVQERAHLFRLAGHAEPTPLSGHTEHVLSSVRDMIDSMNPNPSYALNPIWDVVAWNQAADAVICDFGKIPEERRNFVRLAFTNAAFRKKYVNWEEVAHCAIAHFRSDSVSDVGDLRWLRLIDDLNAESPEFRQWWPRHNVAWPYSWRKELNHPRLGHLVFNTLDLELQRPARLRIVTYIPSKNS